MGSVRWRLAKEFRISQSTISTVLSGTRSLTKAPIVALANFFHVSPAAFLPARAEIAKAMVSELFAGKRWFAVERIHDIAKMLGLAAAVCIATKCA